MKHLQKVKNVYVKVFFAKNGHLKGRYQFDNGLSAKRFAEEMARNTDKELYIMIEDDYNTLYKGNGKEKI